MRRLLLIIFALTALLSACQEEEIKTFSGVDRIMFANQLFTNGNESLKYDTVEYYSFVYEPKSVVFDTFWVNVKVMGGVENIDRQFSVQRITLEGKNNAEPGVHYVDFEAEEYAPNLVIKAGEDISRIPVILLRDESLALEEYFIGIEITANDNFQCGFKGRLKKIISVSDRLSKPKDWDRWSRFYFGEYGEVKHRFMIEILGIKVDDELFNEFKRDYNYMVFVDSFCKQKLKEYNDSHDEPLREEPQPGEEKGQLVDFYPKK